MSRPLLPGPEPEVDGQHQDQDDDRQHQEDARTHRSGGTGKRRHVASEEECLAGLSALPGMVALGILSTAKANSIRGTFMGILQHHRQKQVSPERHVGSDDALTDMLSRHPELANLLEPLLSREQIAEILARAKDGFRGTS